jgi:hypothetical protein
MDILKLAESLTKSEFSNVLEEIRLINYLGLIHDYCQAFDLMVEEGTDIHSALHYAYFDMLIEEETGHWKEELRDRIKDYRKENSL